MNTLDTPITMPDDTKRLRKRSRPTLDPIPEARSGDFEIVNRTTPHDEGFKVLDGGKVRVAGGTTFTILRRASTRRVWMSDTPMEVDSMKAAAKHATGDVLVLGLGLGIMPRLATKATTITVVELEADIAGMVWPHVKDDRMTLYMGDAKVALDTFAAEGRTFDFIYADIWDSLDCEYLPHVNWYLDRCRALLSDGGMVMAWGYGNMIRSYVEQGVELAHSALRGDFDDPRPMAGAKRRWPALMQAIVYALARKADGERFHHTVVNEAVERLARTIVMEPEYLEDLSDRTVARINAEDAGLPEPKPRRHRAPEDGEGSSIIDSLMLGLSF